MFTGNRNWMHYCPMGKKIQYSSALQGPELPDLLPLCMCVHPSAATRNHHSIHIHQGADCPFNPSAHTAFKKKQYNKNRAFKDLFFNLVSSDNTGYNLIRQNLHIDLISSKGRGCLGEREYTFCKGYISISSNIQWISFKFKSSQAFSLYTVYINLTV